MPTRVQLEQLLQGCRVHYSVKQETLPGGVGERSIYELVYKNHKLDVYETVSAITSVSLKGGDFGFASSIVLALELSYGRAQLIYLDKLGELQDLTAHYSRLDLPADVKDALLRQHKALGFTATVINPAELEKAAEAFIERNV